MIDALIADLKREEGWRPQVYKDSQELWTIGYGFLVDPTRKAGMPLEVGDFWLRHNVDRLLVVLPEVWKPYDSQPDDVRRALAEMAYQLGIGGLLAFKQMLAALESGDRESAAKHALDSTWHKQTPARAERVAKLIRGH